MLTKRKKLSPIEKEILYRTFSVNCDKLPESSIINEYQNLEHLFNHMGFREKYTKYSFPILSHEFIVDIKEKINPKNVVDLACGPGWISFWLMKYGINVKDSVDIVEDGDFKNMKFYQSRINITKMDIIDYLVDHNDKNDLLILSWPLYANSLAKRVFENMKNGQLLLYIGEGMSGCTANDDFHELIEDKILDIGIHMDNFFGIHDQCYLVKK